ncbi:hypothetical protein AB0A71_27340 [Kitasatospora aureofaciens]|uniref:hypothetical protein n=1 Tax=Kitasatospora aureofaciens TaxID=1894 RepID=UPI0033FF3086
MAMKTLQVDGEWVRRLVGLAEGAWDQAEVERAFLEYGWAEADEAGAAVVEWGAGPCAPHFFGEAAGDMVGWRFELGDPPVDGGPESSFVQLPCALFWPPFGAEPDDVDGEEGDLDEEFSADWVRFPDAPRAEFHAEYDRLGALLRAELGEPSKVIPADMDDRQEVWHRNGLQIVLHRSDDINTYSHYDVINLRIGPAAAW